MPVQQPYQPQPSYPLATATEYLSSLVSLLSGFRAAQSRFLPMLLSKIAQTAPNANIIIPPTNPTPPSQRQPLSHGSANMFDGASADHHASTSSSDATPFGSPPPMHSSIPVPTGHELPYTELRPQGHVQEPINPYSFPPGMVYAHNVAHGAPQPGNEPPGGSTVGGSGIFGQGMDHTE